MLHETTLISTIVLGLVLAFVFGAIANRFKMPPLVGYLVAGILAGPYTPGFIADQGLAQQLAEIGVILLMFGVGLHFSLKDLLSVRAIAIPGAIVQIGFATVLGMALAALMGWSIGAGFVFGLALSVASTVVLLKAMQDKRLLETERGKIAVGWLIVEDLAMVLALVLIPALSQVLGGNPEVSHDSLLTFIEQAANVDVGLVGTLAITFVKVAVFVGLMLIVGRRLIPFLLHSIAHTGSRELFRLSVLAMALGVAFGASVLFGVSLALGAFFAGMVLAESELSQRAAQETLPLRDAFAVLFFVSVGMLFDPSIVVREPLPVLATVFIIIVGKSVAAYLIVLAFGRPASTALTISASLAQIGEFSFILAGLGVSLAILPEAGQDLILAGALISIILNPLVFLAIDMLRPFLEGKRAEPAHAEPVAVPAEAPPAAAPAEPVASEAVGEEPVPAPVEPAVEEGMPVPTAKTGHVVLVGYGRVGSVVADGLQRDGREFVVVEDADTHVAKARSLGIEVIVGNAAAPDVLRLANVTAASTLIIAVPNAFEAGTAVEIGRKANPALHIIARSHSDEEDDYLRRLGVDEVVLGEREIAHGMLDWLRRGDSDTTVEPEQAAPVTA